MCTICFLLLENCQRTLAFKHQGQTSVLSLRGAAHSWHCCYRVATVLYTALYYSNPGLLWSLQKPKDWTRHLWGLVTVT